MILLFDELIIPRSVMKSEAIIAGVKYFLT